MAVTAGRSWLPSLCFVAGVVSIYAGERMIGAGTSRTVSTGLGLLLVLGAACWRLWRMARAQAEARRAEALLLSVFGIGLAALAVYFVQSDLIGLTSWPRLATAMAALYPALLTACLLPLLLVEMAYVAMARAPVVETGRLKEAFYSGLGLASGLVLVFAAVYVATQRDVKWDLSYFRTARPGTSTRNLVASLDEPVDVYLFFPPANDVHEEVRGYLQDLTRESDLLVLHELDQAVDPVKARELGVSANGTLAFVRGGRREVLPIGVRLEQVRTQLRSLDREIQKRLLLVTRPRRVVYLTVGHGERSETRTQEAQRAPLTYLKDLLRSQNYDVRTLGAAEGLANEVPPDAGAVMIVGPTKQFMAEELEALWRYLQRGGRLMVALDPDSGVALDKLLAPMGIRMVPTTLVNDVAFIRRTHRPIDRAWLLVASYSTHPSVSTLSRVGSEAPMAFLVSGAIEMTPEHPQYVLIDFTVKAHSATFNDLDGSFDFGPPEEVRKSWNLAAAVKRGPDDDPSVPQGRMIAVGDSDLFADGVLENAGNSLFALDGVRWLMGDEAIAGEISSEVDVPVQHTRKQDVVWFYSTIFLVPAAVIAAGFFATRRRQAARAAKEGRR